MVISELHKTLQKRQNELISLLENDSDTIALEKKHQVYGAINELQIVLETLDYYRNKEIISNEKENDFNLFRNSRNRKVLTNMKDNPNNPASASKNIANSGFFVFLKEKIFRNFRKPKKNQTIQESLASSAPINIPAKPTVNYNNAEVSDDLSNNAE
ncbi:hypothetical protein JXB41_09200 [Candidatus Woesearchaeota archaeon]|nr:hypothetical protein [Candidatus Woesearchaeota archaeon]